jgi:two-component system OmpR family response regulator
LAAVILLDDEADIRTEFAAYLEGLGYQVQTVGTIKNFLTLLSTLKPDIAVVDRILPDGDGLDLVKDLRNQGLRCGVIMFTAKDSTQDRIDGFRSGVDHYLTKPVRLQELGAVVQSLIWRLQAAASWRLIVSAWQIRAPCGAVIRLTGQESAFLHLLVVQAGQAVNRKKVIQSLGKNFADYDPRNLDALMLRLRKKIANATSADCPIKTVHGVGYMVENDWVLSDV